MFIQMTSRQGKQSRRRKVHRSRGNLESRIILMGLLTGNRKEDVSAMKVQAKRKGRTGRRRRGKREEGMGVKISAVATLGRIIGMKHPTTKLLGKSLRAPFPARPGAWNA